MKKSLALLLSLSLLLFVFAGCNTGGQTPDAAPADTPSAAPTDPSSAAGAEEPSATPGESYIIKAAHGAPENVGLHQGWVKFKEEIEQESGGRVTVEIYPNQQLGGDRELIEGTQMGDIHACSPSSTPVAPFCSEYYVLDIPFLFTDRESTYAILDGDPGKRLLAATEQVGLKGLGYMENGFRNFTNSRNPVRTPEDVKGLKLRTMENKIHMAFWEMAGAAPTPMAYGELFTALQQKTVDAQENPFELIYSSKFYEVQNYISETQHIYTPYVALFNLDWFNSRSAEDQALIESCMATAVNAAREYSVDAEASCKAEIEKAGVEIIALSAEEKAAFREAMSAVLPQVREAAGDEIVDLFIVAADY